jgi:enoyl-CoA hydratase/carnithine racemase
MSEVLLQETADGVRTLTLNRPNARNALGDGLPSALYDALLAADEDGEVRVLVLTGADPAFCAGLDLKEAARDSAAYSRQFAENNCITQVSRVSKPVIGAVNGPAFTGGLEIALGCDFLVASERAVFADTHARVGVLPGGGLTARLPRLVGAGYARRMSFTGDVVDAAEALRVGLVTEVVQHDRLLARAGELARAIAEIPPRTIGALKRVYVEGGAGVVDPALEAEQRAAGQVRPEWDSVDERRRAVTERSRAQLAGSDQ